MSGEVVALPRPRGKLGRAIARALNKPYLAEPGRGPHGRRCRKAYPLPAQRDVGERNRLVLANMGLVGLVVGRLPGHWLKLLGGRDDAFQVGTLGLLRAAELWDDRRPARFATYACRAIRRTLTNRVRDGGLVRVPRYQQQGAIQTRFVASADVLRGATDLALGETLAGREPDPAEAVAEADYLARLPALVEALLLLLPASEAEAVRLYYLEGRNGPQIAQLWGCSASRVQQVLGQGLARLRRQGVPPG